MQHLGDVTKIDGRKVPTVDVIIGGSPCQDLSVAGKRAGLSGERSCLFLDQIRIVREMREGSSRNASKADAVRPRYMVWENVPGAFSSNGGEDFREVLQETLRIVSEESTIPRPSGGVWTTSGTIMGDQFSISWRVFDAQFWGVPQSRRRIALVADFGGKSAPEILFERKGLPRYNPPSEITGEGTAARSGRNVENAICYDMTHADAIIREYKEKVPTLQNRMGTGGNQVPIYLDRAAFNQGVNAAYDPIIKESEISQALVSRGPSAVCYTVGNGQSDQTGLHSVAGALNCMHDQQVVLYDSENGLNRKRVVRRLTPLECERLQGFPDGWTDIGEWTDGTGKKRKTTDVARYKALGNSIALPSWRWLLKRLCGLYSRPPTMASLFDGIGGFPLLWEEINGKGTCLWASEIEEFPLAVTKRHFGR